MSREVHQLVAAKIPTYPDGWHNDGLGLYLRVSRAGTARSWVFRYRCRQTSKLVDMGLGSVADLSLREARAKVADLRRQLLDGLDPRAERERLERERIEAEEARKAEEARAAAAVKPMTFGDCVTKYIEAHAAGWRNAKHRQQWRNTLDTYAATLKELPVAEVNQDEVFNALERIWKRKTETASRVRQRIEAVLDWATVREHRKGPNPARWKGALAHLLPSPARLTTVEHHAAMPWAEMPGFMTLLRKGKSLSAVALELVILTASRVGEIVGGRWSEIDLDGTDGAVWTIPGARMKAHKEHRVPLCPRAVELLKSLPRVGDYVFPGMKKGAHLNPESLRKYLQHDMKKPQFTVHGFRSSFRDWAAETTNFPRDVAEGALAHSLKDKTEAAYKRGDLLRKRRRMLNVWDDYLSCRETEGITMHIVLFPKGDAA